MNKWVQLQCTNQKMKDAEVVLWVSCNHMLFLNLLHPQHPHAFASRASSGAAKERPSTSAPTCRKACCYVTLIYVLSLKLFIYKLGRQHLPYFTLKKCAIKE